MYRATLETISDGRAGLLQKVRAIRDLVEQAKRDPDFRARVLALVHDEPEKDHSAEIARVVGFVRSHVRYVRDPWSPHGLELFTDPRTLLDDVDQGRAAGDCDDHVLLASAMLETIGYPTRYVVGAIAPHDYRHIWLEVQHPKRGWLPVELTKKDWPTFRDPRSKFPIVERYSGGESMNGLGDLRARRALARDRRRAASMAHARMSKAQRLQAKGRMYAARAGKLPGNLPVGRGIQTPIGNRFARHAYIESRAYGRGGGRSARRAIAGLGEITSLPRSWWNTRPDQPYYADNTPSDHQRAEAIREMFPPSSVFRYGTLLGPDGSHDDLGAILEDWDAYRRGPELGSVLSKFTKRQVKSAKKATRAVRKEVKRTTKRVGKEAKRGLVNYGPEAAAIAAGIFTGPEGAAIAYGITSQAREAYLAQKAGGMEAPPQLINEPYYSVPYAAPAPAPPAIVIDPSMIGGSSLPASPMSGMAGPSYVQVAEGFALPPGVPDQVAVEDDGWSGYADEQGWDRPLPGAGVGSYVPTPPDYEFPNAPARAPFSAPTTGESGGDVDPGFGMGYGTLPLYGSEAFDEAAIREALIESTELGDMDNTCMQVGFGTLGAESWLTQLAQSAASQFINYQAGRLQKKGYLPAGFSLTGQRPPPPPPSRYAAPPPPPPPPPRQPLARSYIGPPGPQAGGGGFAISPTMATMAIGGLALLMLMRR